MRTYKTNPEGQADSVDHAERQLQLLCEICRALHRIESHLSNSAGTPQPNNKIIRFNGEGRQ